ncbi:MAG: Na+/H+ antiporter NhaA [Flavobacteriaceae bacterium]|jgi:NhaA family Na+:H+ antiporter|nr:Na+/H+ antiporter NhaA [Flavobacteriaceae bacterium]
MILTKYFKEFFRSSKSSGIVLIFCVAISLMIANSSFAKNFQNLLDKEIGIGFFSLKYSVSIWINDGLMAIFFLLAGLEIKRELAGGELSNFKKASLPIFAAIGGMLVPALIFLIFNFKTPYSKGWGIPMATDIAFSLAILSTLGKRVPASLKIFLAALAIVDDLGAIIVIAVFYSGEIRWNDLGFSVLIFLILILFNYLKIKKLIFYIVPGILLWYFVHHSGVHAAISGVLLAFTIPSEGFKTKISPLKKLEHRLHFPVNFFIMPLFALANTNITFTAKISESLFSSVGLGIIFGLFAGKILGINLFSWLAVKLKLSKIPSNIGRTQMLGVGFLAGIGFTMSIFMAMLSFKNSPEILEEAKFAVLTASVLSGIFGYFVLRNGWGCKVIKL